MIFDVISSTISVNKWGTNDGTLGLSFEVVPHDREYLEIGDKYVLCAAGYHKMLHSDRRRIGAKIWVTDNPDHLNRPERREGQDLCGWASFYDERESQLDFSPPILELAIVVEPALFGELLEMRITTPSAATIHADIDDLEFGWEPDGSHKIWKFNGPPSGRSVDRRPVKSFWINLFTFVTTEGAIAEHNKQSLNREFAESTDLEKRKLADPLPDRPEDRLTTLLAHCRLLLILILAAATLLILRS